MLFLHDHNRAEVIEVFYSILIYLDFFDFFYIFFLNHL